MIDNAKTVIIADDHPIFRMGLNSFIDKFPGYKVMAECSNGQEVVQQLQKSTPNMLILDLDMPILSGLDVVEYVLQNHLSPNIIVLTAHTDATTIKKLIDYKFISILFKESALTELPNCIKSIEEGKTFYSPLCHKLISSQSKRIAKDQEINERLMLLTPSEINVLKLIAQHFTTKDIAHKLNNSNKTIENHRTNISLKLGLTGTNKLLHFALEHKESILSI